MSLPATDNFNRADGPLGTNWASSVLDDLEILSNEVRDALEEGSQYWSADTPNDAQYAQARISGLGTGADYGGATVRHSATDFVVISAEITEARFSVYWYNGGAYTLIGSAYSTAPALNDVMKITANGSAFEGFVNGVSRISGSNGSAPSSGNGGLNKAFYGGGGDTGRLDDFEVGNLSSAVRKFQKASVLGV
jgi:hypothetical protein